MTVCKLGMFLFAWLITLNPLTSQNLSDLFEEVAPSVVVIGTVQSKQLGGGVQNVVSQEGLGSGVLISKDGLIWTAAHVVNVAELVKVKFSDGSVFDAEVLTSDETTDLAMLKVIGNVSKYTPAKIGRSDDIRIGADIFVIGAPRGLEYSLTRGIVSGRKKMESPVFGAVNIEFLQVDAAINPGNSGGPIFNMKGEVVGIASFILSESGGFEGIGFAASSSVALRVLMRDNLIWSGIEGVQISGAISKALNVPGEGGYLVVTVASKGLGAKVGLQGGTVKANIEGTDLMLGGDIILELAGFTIANPVEDAKARDAISRLPVGSVVEIKFLRGGEVLTRNFTIL